MVTTWYWYWTSSSNSTSYSEDRQKISRESNNKTKSYRHALLDRWTNPQAHGKKWKWKGRQRESITYNSMDSMNVMFFLFCFILVLTMYMNHKLFTFTINNISILPETCSVDTRQKLATSNHTFEELYTYIHPNFVSNTTFRKEKRKGLKQRKIDIHFSINGN